MNFSPDHTGMLSGVALYRFCTGSFILNVHGSNVPIRSRRQFINTVILDSWLFIFFSAPSLMCLSLMCRGYVIDDLFGARHSMVIYFLHFGNIWFSVITSIYSKETSSMRIRNFTCMRF